MGQSHDENREFPVVRRDARNHASAVAKIVAADGEAECRIITGEKAQLFPLDEKVQPIAPSGKYRLGRNARVDEYFLSASRRLESPAMPALKRQEFLALEQTLPEKEYAVGQPDKVLADPHYDALFLPVDACFRFNEIPEWLALFFLKASRACEAALVVYRADEFPAIAQKQTVEVLQARDCETAPVRGVESLQPIAEFSK